MSRSPSPSHAPSRSLSTRPSDPPHFPPVPVPAPVAAAPATCGVPTFDPLRVRGGGHRLRRALLRRRRAMAAGLAVTAAALAASGAGGPGVAAGAEERAASRAAARGGGGAPGAGADAQPGAAKARLVTAPVRIADVATVRLLRPGDRVDVIAAAHSPVGEESDARVIATGALVESVPRALESATDGGALVLLTVARDVAAELAGASTNSRLAVTLC
ncbi:hypothetical protein [Streptomyces sp. IB2014 016-6]|uniref:hypothetical protein n=1 Tax=Streptomyces sp. IB2014 016-6 TaxID=2517818 RepID=UPI0011C7D743|nr:hypothetical protein [Streptomyces sp. IB2014 016-6]TXL86975.1 hypothetical protein EW053_25400 [Streptomyces sp. IB2014 016-6]